MVATMQAAQDIYKSGIFTFVLVDGKEVDITEALNKSGSLLLTRDNLGDMQKAIQEYDALMDYLEIGDDVPSGRELADLMDTCRWWLEVAP